MRAIPGCRPLTRGLVGITSGELAEMGLSSSASIGLAYLLALEEVNGLKMSATANIRLDQAIENDYLGLSNGILDQAAILLSRRDALTVIDCKEFAESPAPSLSRPVPRVPPAPPGPVLDRADNPEALPRGIHLIPRSTAMPPFTLLLACSGLTKSVLSTDYNRRVGECAEAARLLLRTAGRPEAPSRLAEIGAEEFAQYRGCLNGSPGPAGRTLFQRGATRLRRRASMGDRELGGIRPIDERIRPQFHRTLRVRLPTDD